MKNRNSFQMLKDWADELDKSVAKQNRKHMIQDILGVVVIGGLFIAAMWAPLWLPFLRAWWMS